MKLLPRLASAHAALCSIAEKFCSPILLFVRLYWGWQFAQTGWGKLHNQAKVIDFFRLLWPSHVYHLVARFGREFL